MKLCGFAFGPYSDEPWSLQSMGKVSTRYVTFTSASSREQRSTTRGTTTGWRVRVQRWCGGCRILPTWYHVQVHEAGGKRPGDPRISGPHTQSEKHASLRRCMRTSSRGASRSETRPKTGGLPAVQSLRKSDVFAALLFHLVARPRGCAHRTKPEHLVRRMVAIVSHCVAESAAQTRRQGETHQYSNVSSTKDVDDHADIWIQVGQREL